MISFDLNKKMELTPENFHKMIHDDNIGGLSQHQCVDLLTRTLVIKHHRRSLYITDVVSTIVATVRSLIMQERHIIRLKHSLTLV